MKKTKVAHQRFASRGSFHSFQLALDSKSPERVRKLVISHSHLHLLIENSGTTRTRRRLRKKWKLSPIVECVCPSRHPPRTFRYTPAPFSPGMTCAGLFSAGVVSSPRCSVLVVLESFWSLFSLGDCTFKWMEEVQMYVFRKNGQYVHLKCTKEKMLLLNARRPRFSRKDHGFSPSK